jgi:hypothetical protein
MTHLHGRTGLRWQAIAPDAGYREPGPPLTGSYHPICARGAADGSGCANISSSDLPFRTKVKVANKVRARIVVGYLSFPDLVSASPDFTPAMKAAHSEKLRDNSGLESLLESRSRTPSAHISHSRQSPFPLKLLFRHDGV